MAHLLNGEAKQSKLFQEFLDKAIAEILSLAKEIQKCKDCELHNFCNKPLPGAGYPLANILLLKESPTALEDAENVAFFGKIGESLRSGFAKLNLDITDVYGTSAIKCSLPESSSSPLKKISEKNIPACKKHLEAEIEIIQPKIILAMGEVSVKALNAIASFKNFSLTPGKITPWRQGITVIITHSPHEAFQNPSLKQEFRKALKVLKTIEKAKL
ncbi:uracil-DNA glycosylase [Candidatus Oleimmundimicrobium sp.]|uniref:uracil-DNA glycosylase n=1 Tax=Candidatus Oleimmundimicrobium sp. TaxID=3060597 RepID=UPI002725AF87|nr:uracil-DNA glycosylase [Candidatus Oleimmundimicrobium sp.]MDO8886847.1 uracil-DNA glycosylase [Candidatus Oleimmundimicrobium sp.]